MDIKNTTVRVKAGPADGLDEGEFSAYASVFGNRDSYGDVVVKGAFADTLTEWKSSGAPIPLLFGHNMTDPDYNIGYVKDAVEDDRGLLVTAQLDLEGEKAKSVYRLVKGKRINQMSFAYDILDAGEDTKDGQKVQLLKSLKLYEVSVVPIGANPETEILAVKANVDAILATAKAGREHSAATVSSLRSAVTAIKEAAKTLDGLIKSAEGSNPDDQEKASGQAAAKDEEPQRAKSEEPRVNPSVNGLASRNHLERSRLDAYFA